MTHEKKKMTRAEAVKLFAKYHIYGDANDTVDFYIEAGMLEIVEEKTEINRLNNVIKQLQLKDYSWEDIVNTFRAYGFKLTKDT